MPIRDPRTKHACHAVERRSNSRETAAVAQPFPRPARPGRRAVAWLLVFAGLFALGHDFWNWGRVGPLWLGLPAWLWYFFALNLVMFGLFLMLARGREAARLPDEPRAR